MPPRIDPDAVPQARTALPRGAIIAPSAPENMRRRSQIMGIQTNASSCLAWPCRHPATSDTTHTAKRDPKNKTAPHGRRQHIDAYGELVGAIGFEPTTPCPPGRCATKLRYAPTITKTDPRIIPRLAQAPQLYFSAAACPATDVATTPTRRAGDRFRSGDPVVQWARTVRFQHDWSAAGHAGAGARR